MKLTLRFVLIGLAIFASIQAHADNPLVRLATNQGEIIVELYPEKAPRTVANFLHYVDSGHYNGTIFHRAISKFVVQGGAFTRIFSTSQLSNRSPTKLPTA